MGFDVQGGSEAAIRLMDSIQRPWSLCENLGATESIITACAVMTHANMLKEDRLKVGVTSCCIYLVNRYSTALTVNAMCYMVRFLLCILQIFSTFVVSAEDKISVQPQDSPLHA